MLAMNFIIAVILNVYTDKSVKFSDELGEFVILEPSEGSLAIFNRDSSQVQEDITLKLKQF